ncbi:MAG: phosphate ABC transporter permease PstA [Verrucomicrobiales bacterium]|jgi:phosphate transport system permease protein|nr:phosphate ABC transporter permease PstA [Verrucomicrobiales bacterium]
MSTTSLLASSRQNNHLWRKIKNWLMVSSSIGSALLVILPLGLVLFYLVYKGAAAINLGFFTNVPAPPGDTDGGMANAIVGSFLLLGMAVLVGAPMGILGGIYLSEYGNEKLNGAIRFCADVLNGVPSIVWSIIVYEVLVVPMRGYSLLSGGIALGLMMIPLVLRTTEEVLVLVPNSYREAALALGIARWQIIVKIVVATAYKGIITAVLVAGARIAGETAPLLFTAFGNLNWCTGLNQPVAALPLQIYAYAISAYEDWHRQAWAGALVLIGFVFIINISVRFMTRERKA